MIEEKYAGGYVVTDNSEPAHRCEPGVVYGRSAEEAYHDEILLVGCPCGKMFRPDEVGDILPVYVWTEVHRWSRYYRKLKKKGFVS